MGLIRHLKKTCKQSGTDKQTNGYRNLETDLAQFAGSVKTVFGELTLASLAVLNKKI